MTETVYLAGGCFWGTEAYFKLIDGVVNTEVGYANGNIENPSYEQVCSGSTNFVETVKVQFDSTKLSLNQLLDAYFKVIDPTLLNKQGPDVGTQYRTGIYYEGNLESEVTQFLNSKQCEYSKPIVTENKKLENYYSAELYHQDYLDKNPGGYCHIDLSQY